MVGKHRLDKRGSITIVAAVLFTALIATAGLVTEYGDSLLTRVTTQQVADLAAYSGALAYNAVGTTTALDSAVDRVANLNGVANSQVVASLVTSPSGDGNQAVKVTVTSDVSLALSQVLEKISQVSITATAYAEIGSNGTGSGAGCIIALESTGTGVKLSGGTALSASSCAVASNSVVVVPCGTSITTTLVNYDSATVPSQPCGGIQPPTGKTLTIAQKLTSDPLASNAGITAAVGHITTVAALTSPSAPTVPTGGPSLNFGYTYSGSSSPSVQITPSGCSATGASGTWTVTCSGSGPFNFGSITTGGGIAVNFNTSGSSSATYNFNGYIYNTGTAMTFGPGTYNIAQGVQTGGGTTTTFGAGTHNIGPSPTANCSAGNYSICHTGTTLTFNGPSTFVLSNGIYNSGGETLALGAGSSANSYNIGASSGGNAVNVGGGSKTTFGDVAGGVFQLAGMLNVASGGGSCLTLPAAAQHDINGNFSTAGGTILGNGIYTVNGYVALGANGGGDVSCGGSTVGISGSSVSFVISAASTIASGTCAGEAFCIASGYGHVTLTSPTSGNTEDMIVIGPTSTSNTAGATFAEGATNTSLSGVFYIPNGPFTLSGGASVGNGTGQCLEVIASEVTQTGGTTLASSCSGVGGTSVSNTVVLVQ